MSRYSVRTFVEGDEVELASLFHQANEKYVGFIEKTPRAWKRSFLQRPGASPEGILIVERDGTQIVGYAVVGSSGKVHDVCIRSDTDRDVILSVLLKDVERYAREQGAERVSISVPPGGRALDRELTRSGYYPWLKFLTGIPLDFAGLIEPIARENLSTGKPRVEGTLSIQLGKSGRLFRSPAHRGGLFVRIGNGDVRVAVGQPDAEVTIHTSVFTLTSIILREKGIVNSILHGELKVHPLRRLPKAVRLLSLLVLPYRWYSPGGDMV
jgi:hypothetical protein